MFRQQKYDKAKSYYDQAIALNLAFRDTVEIINNLINLGTVNTSLKAYSTAEYQLKRALILTANGHYLDQRGRIYSALRNLASVMEQYKDAYFYFLSYQRITDSLYSQKQMEKTLELEAMYANLMKDRDLLKAREDIAQQRVYMVLAAGVVFITVIIIVFMWRFIRIKRANERALLLLNQSIETQASELSLANQQVNRVNETLEDTIRQRMEVIRAQNQRLLEFSFMNSHKIRAPLATLLGLLNLFEEERPPSDELISHMKVTAEKMDQMIHEVSRQLEKEDLIK